MANMSDKQSFGDRTASVSAGSPQSFANDTERRVAQVFSEVLNLKRVAVEDDIFSLGGDSFELVRVALELERQFQMEIPTQLLESAGRIRALAHGMVAR